MEQTFPTFYACTEFLKNSPYAKQNEPLGPVTLVSFLDLTTGKVQFLQITYAAPSPVEKA